MRIIAMPCRLRNNHVSSACRTSPYRAPSRRGFLPRLQPPGDKLFYVPSILVEYTITITDSWGLRHSDTLWGPFPTSLAANTCPQIRQHTTRNIQTNSEPLSSRSVIPIFNDPAMGLSILAT